jgi:dihydrofolate synthase/folylpolyglutamate synthase
MLRHQTAVSVSPEAMANGIRAARWPARLQRLSPGPLTALVPGRTIWLDGAHNADAAMALAAALANKAPLALVFALMANRRLDDVLGALAPLVAEAHIVPIPGHAHHEPSTVADYAQPDLITRCYTASDIPTALRQIAANPDGPRAVLIAGSLYLAGEVLRLNEEVPD